MVWGQTGTSPELKNKLTPAVGNEEKELSVVNLATPRMIQK